MKSFAIVSALALSLALTACGKKEEAAPVEAASAVEAPAEAAVTEAAPADATVAAEAAPVEAAE